MSPPGPQPGVSQVALGRCPPALHRGRRGCFGSPLLHCYTVTSFDHCRPNPNLHPGPRIYPILRENRRSFVPNHSRLRCHLRGSTPGASTKLAREIACDFHDLDTKDRAGGVTVVRTVVSADVFSRTCGVSSGGVGSVFRCPTFSFATSSQSDGQGVEV